MRKALMSLIAAATVLTPVAAMAQDSRADRVRERYQRLEQRNQERYGNQAQREAVREQRQATRQERQATRQTARQPRQVAQPAPARADNRQRFERRQRTQPRSTVNENWQGDRNDPRMEEHRRRYQQLERQNQRQYDRNDRRDWRGDRRDDRRDWRNDRRWDRNAWRNDRRYDWQRYRYQNRNLFRVNPYYSPFRGHSYSRLQIGVILGAPFYSNRYWIGDPWQYRLPHAPAGTQWVRYYNDVLLVDVYTGEVIDVIYNFFW